MAARTDLEQIIDAAKSLLTEAGEGVGGGGWREGGVVLVSILYSLSN